MAGSCPRSVKAEGQLTVALQMPGPTVLSAPDGSNADSWRTDLREQRTANPLAFESFTPPLSDRLRPISSVQDQRPRRRQRGDPLTHSLHLAQTGLDQLQTYALRSESGRSASPAQTLTEQVEVFRADVAEIDKSLKRMIWHVMSRFPVVVGYVSSGRKLTAANYNVAPTSPLPAWVNRANRVHVNAVENIAPFAVVVLIAQAVGYPVRSRRCAPRSTSTHASRMRWFTSAALASSRHERFSSQ